MTTDIRDCPPTHEYSTKLPSWVLRFAYDGEEWLVLGDMEPYEHTCGWPADEGPRYGVWFALALERCSETCAAIVAPFSRAWPHFNSDSLPEAEAAFKRIEQEWHAAKAGVL